MSNVVVDREKIDLLANAISAKSGEPLTLTLDEMVEAVDGIETGKVARNIVKGTFTTPSTEGVGSVTFENPDGYYPIALMIWVEGGVLNPESDWYNAVSQYAIGLYSAVKNVTTSPSDNVYWYMWAIPKASSANTFSMVSTSAASITSGRASSDPLSLVKLLNYNQISYYTKGSSYGFLPDTTYSFVVVYSLL